MAKVGSYRVGLGYGQESVVAQGAPGQLCALTLEKTTRTFLRDEAQLGRGDGG